MCLKSKELEDGKNLHTREKKALLLIIKFGLWPCPYQSLASLCLLCYTNSELHDLHIILYNTLIHAGCPKI